VRSLQGRRTPDKVPGLAEPAPLDLPGPGPLGGPDLEPLDLPDPAPLDFAEARASRVAVHEAGHVVASVLVGGPVPRRVTVEPGPDYDGRTWWDASAVEPAPDAPADARADHVWRAAVVSLAGLAAEALAGVAPSRAALFAAARPDVAEALRLAGMLEGEAPEVLADLVRDALEILGRDDARWMVAALAEVLAKARTLEGAALAEVLAKARTLEGAALAEVLEVLAELPAGGAP
jgi:hypothetical protein